MLDITPRKGDESRTALSNPSGTIMPLPLAAQRLVVLTEGPKVQ